MSISKKHPDITYVDNYKLNKTKLKPSWVERPLDNISYNKIFKNLLESKKPRQSKFGITYLKISGEKLSYTSEPILSKEGLMEPQKINLNLNTIVQNIDEKNNSANLLVEYDSLHQDNFLSAVLSKANYKNDLNCKIKSQEFVDQVNIFPSIKIDSTSDKKIEEFYEISFREETGKLMFKKKISL